MDANFVIQLERSCSTGNPRVVFQSAGFTRESVTSSKISPTKIKTIYSLQFFFLSGGLQALVANLGQEVWGEVPKNEMRRLRWKAAVKHQKKTLAKPRVVPCVAAPISRSLPGWKMGNLVGSCRKT